MSRAQLGGQRLFVGAASTGSSELSFSLREARTRLAQKPEKWVRCLPVSGIWSAIQDGSAAGTFAQRFDAGGAKIGGEFRVNANTVGNQIEPAVAVLGLERFVVAWTSVNQDGNGYGVYARLYSDLIFADGFDAGP